MVSFRIRQNNKTLVKTEGENAEAEVMQHAMEHRKNGEVTIQHNAEGHWKRFALLCQWPAK